VPRVVCVLGMHRSGTSLVTRLVHGLGFDLGPSEALIVDPPEHNRGGYWEHRGFNAIDEQLLARLGGSWHQPPALLDGWEAQPALDDLALRARDLVAEMSASSSRWAWKDPRASLTLPFWQRLLPDASYVVCVRDPASVAASLRQRDAFDSEKAARLWLLHTASALRHTEGRPRLVVFYDDMLDDTASTLGRLARFLDTSTNDVASIVQPSWRHHRHAPHDALRGTAGSPAAAFYAALRNGVR
jgi:hypothetical protein